MPSSLMSSPSPVLTLAVALVVAELSAAPAPLKWPVSCAPQPGQRGQRNITSSDTLFVTRRVASGEESSGGRGVFCRVALIVTQMLQMPPVTVACVIPAPLHGRGYPCPPSWSRVIPASLHVDGYPCPPSWTRVIPASLHGDGYPCPPSWTR
eukprot:1181103-Prorocentrum_minimum.AAC.1